MRGPIFAMREFMTGSVTSVFYSIRIDGSLRYFHVYCDLEDVTTPSNKVDEVVDQTHVDRS